MTGDELPPLLVAVDVPLVGDERHKNWAKVVGAVDASKASGWAFEGEFISPGGIQDVPVGAVVLVYGERGSRSNPQSQARLYLANGDGTLTHHATAKGRAWARTLRDDVEELIDSGMERGGRQLDWQPDLMRYSDTALAEELRRRKTATDG